ncbi:hypothetical protein JR316_0012497 [Psilocybe cubensis]|uniref:Uncharacterized protein n=2 Tax=Psilocybe cubensis TaxID=181762 RepID=A0A8H7XR41_PSICU|nr:hypothetical protein JR316_0012497 [Psilocybe cubensis]KAH9475386.1 hypothetical protein JR316_0012497 [Psilocybe cubensis]
MFSRTNHHHQHGQCASSPAPRLGTRQQHSPDSTPGPTESESNGQKLLQTKRSSHTKRLIKKGRTHPWKSVDASPGPSPQHSVNTPIPLADPHSAPNTDAAPPFTLPLPAVSLDIVAGQVAHLKTLLDSILATVAIIQSIFHGTVTLSDQTMHAALLLHSTLFPADPKYYPQNPERVTKPRSYATVAKTTPVAQSTYMPQRTFPAPTARGPIKTRPHITCPTRHYSSNNCLIASWDNFLLTQLSGPLIDFVERLNSELLLMSRDSPCHVLGAKVSKSGRLIIHTTNNTGTARIKACLITILQATQASDCFSNFHSTISDPSTVYSDVPWHGIVVHDLPADLLCNFFDSATPKNSTPQTTLELLE